MQTLNFALIGVGRFGKHYMRLLQQMKGVRLVAVAARTKKSLLGVSHLLRDDVLQLTNSDALLKMKSIDCVVIATPPSTHFMLAKKAIMAGKHVLLEKPMVKNISEAKKLRKIAGKSKKTFMVAHQFVYNGNVNHLMGLVKKGSLGKTRIFVAQHFYPGPMRKDAGCFLDAGTHQLSVLQHLLSPGKIKSVSGASISFSGSGLDDFASATIEFNRGITAHISVCWCYPEKTRFFAVVGSRKTAIYDDVAGKLVVFNSAGADKNQGRRNVKTSKASTGTVQREPLKNELEHFIHCVRQRARPLTGIESSYEISGWIDKIGKSLKKIK